MQTDKYVLKHGTIEGVTYPQIEIVDEQSTVVLRIAEKYKNDKVHLIHIGSHSGMRGGGFHTYDVNVVPPSNIKDLSNYAQTFLDEGNFVHPLIWRENITSFYHFNPRDETILAYKESQCWNLWMRTLKAVYEPCMGGHWIVWGYAYTRHALSTHSTQRDFTKVAKNTSKDSLPLVISINLDALQWANATLNQQWRERRAEVASGFMTNGLREMAAYWQGRERYKHYSSAPLLMQLSPKDFTFLNYEYCDEEEMKQRVKRITTLVETLRKPDLVLISESQRPVPTCPPERIDLLESRVLESFRRVF